MIHIKNIQTIDNKVIDFQIESTETYEIDGTGLTLLPALIDPHVHFRTPGAEHKENWISAAKAAIQGGVTTVIDMPNTSPVCASYDTLMDKHRLISKQLQEVGIPLRYHLYFGAHRQQLQEIPKIKSHAIGIKIFMGSSTGNLLIDDESTLRTIFNMASDLDLLVSVHAEDEEIIRQNHRCYTNQHLPPSMHSQIRSRDAAVKATSLAISLAKEYGTRLCILHVSTKEEVELIKKAKQQQSHLYAEVAPHHLFFNTHDYERWGTKVLVNPPIREEKDQIALWMALNEGTIDFIGSDHAPHTLTEKFQHYGKAPSGIPSIELVLPLLLNAVNDQLLTLSTLINATRTHIEKIFRLPQNNDVVLVDMHALKQVKDRDLKTLCGWSPYNGRFLKGWPVCTILDGKSFFNPEFKKCALSPL